MDTRFGRSSIGFIFKDIKSRIFAIEESGRNYSNLDKEERKASLKGYKDICSWQTCNF